MYLSPVMFLSDLYLPSFLTALVVSVSVGALVSSVRSRLSGVSPRSGGVALVVAFIVAVLSDGHLVVDRVLAVLLAVLLVVFLFGLADDRRRFSWRIQLVFQVSATLALFLGGVAIQSIGLPGGGAWFLHPELSWWPSLPLTVVWLLFIVNAVNWSDGVDGSAGSVALVGFLAIFFLALRPEVDQPPTAILALAAAGATLGFLVFNFPPARIIAGTSGAYFWGLLLGTLAVFSGTKIATTLLVLALPALDAVWVTVDRWRSGVSVFQGDRERHLHYRLRRAGWSDRRIAVTYFLVAASAAVLALDLRPYGKLWLFVSCGAGMLLASSWLRGRVKIET